MKRSAKSATYFKLAVTVTQQRSQSVSDEVVSSIGASQLPYQGVSASMGSLYQYCHSHHHSLRHCNVHVTESAVTIASDLRLATIASTTTALANEIVSNSIAIAITTKLADCLGNGKAVTRILTSTHGSRSAIKLLVLLVRFGLFSSNPSWLLLVVCRPRQDCRTGCASGCSDICTSCATGCLGGGVSNSFLAAALLAARPATTCSPGLGIVILVLISCC
jgi:hypothetical protein